ncbi:choice-of-anchor I family protein [Emcibacter sp. SYSU 3D8]|uniref:choice-of-anchor I family protein n=1 Tax=Emcibacter sp. SYSU 3D8 TaxID=3133969 RepID=UPI0031FE9708
MRSILTLALAAAAAGLFAAQDASALTLKQILRHESGVFDKSAAEIVVFDAGSKRFYVVNGASPSIDILQLGDGSSADTASWSEAGTLALGENESPTSVAVHDGLVVAAVHGAKELGRPGKVIFFDAAGTRLAEVETGFLPDMVTFTPDGKFVLTANEGEPTDDMDPEGSVSIIDISGGAAAARAVTIGFESLTADAMRAAGVRVFPGKEPRTDFEPEYIAVSADSTTAWVSLQENNALAKFDIATATLTAVLPLGTKDHSQAGMGMDPNDKDGKIDIAPVPVRGLYMPDTIAAFSVGGNAYLITANEGDARNEDERVEKAKIDPAALSGDQRKKLERLKISTIDGDTDGDGDIDALHAYGARSVTIWDIDGKVVWDSGDQIEKITAARLGNNFNNNNDENKYESRSDDKGPEPETVDVGVIDGYTYAFIGLERVGGVMMFNVSNPASPTYAGYENNRDFTTSLDFSLPGDLKAAGDLGPECVRFIPADKSPYGVPLLAVASEVSGTVTLYTVSR